VELQLARAPAAPADFRFGFQADFTDIKDGILLTDVPANSAAAKAGLRKGDRVVAIDGEQFADQQAYLNYARMLQPGEAVAMTVNREGKQLQFQVTAAEPPRTGRGGFGAGRGPGGGFGAFIDPADQKEGALVARVIDESSAAAAGLKVGDRVTAVNGKPVKDSAIFRELIGNLRSGDKVELQVLREGKSLKLQGVVK
jgi:S1-C subfamily serine protease